MRRIRSQGYGKVMDWETIAGLKNSVKNEISDKRQWKKSAPTWARAPTQTLVRANANTQPFRIPQRPRRAVRIVSPSPELTESESEDDIVVYYTRTSQHFFTPTRVTLGAPCTPTPPSVPSPPPALPSQSSSPPSRRSLRSYSLNASSPAPRVARRLF